VTAPDDHVGAILGDLSSRRGHIMGVETDGHFQTIRARVPQKELYHYSTVVRSLTGGRGRHSEEFSHYAEVPPELAQKILAERARRNGNASAATSHAHTSAHAPAHAHA
jgi:elongation factor G